MADSAVSMDSAKDGEISQLRNLVSLLQQQIILLKDERADLESDLRMCKSKLNGCEYLLNLEKSHSRDMERRFRNERDEYRIACDILKVRLKELKDKPKRFKRFRNWISKTFRRTSRTPQVNIDDIRVSAMIPTDSLIETWV